MKFEAKFFGDKLKIVNPRGTVGVVVLWSPVAKVFSMLRKAGADLNPETSKIAVMGNLYGEGFRHLLRNLLYNPQIDAVVVFGKSLNDSADYLPNFFEKGVEPYSNEIEYESAGNGKAPSAVKVVGTNYVMDDLVVPESFLRPPKIVAAPYDDEGAKRIGEFLAGHVPRKPAGGRIFADVPQVRVSTFPSDVSTHTVAADTPSAAWKLLVHRVFRFGKRVRLKKGERIELRNVKAVVGKPVNEGDEIVRGCGFDPDDFRKYQRDILSSEKTFDYTYGNRIRAHFGIDCLEEACGQLKEEEDDRKAYIALWDNGTDVTGAHSPCLVSLFFRRDAGMLHLTATYRSHNVSKAWLENVYGLMAIQRYAAVRAGLNPASITIVSHSATLDPAYLEKASAVRDEVATSAMFNPDPNGYFRISIDRDDIVVKHYSPGGIMLDEYRGGKPGSIRQKLYRNCAISDLNHAMYIGSELQKAYRCIVEGTVYTQDQ